MAISFMPRKFILLLELAGFSGNRSFGLEAIQKASEISGSSLRKFGAFGMLAGYNGFAEYFYCLGEPNIPLINQLTDEFERLVPGSVWNCLNEGFKRQNMGDFSSALTSYSRIVSHPKCPRYFHYGLNWQSCWLSAYDFNISAFIY